METMMSNLINYDARQTDTGVNDLFTHRWSPRAFQKCDIEQSSLIRIMEAARWAPSCFNAQPWRFYTSTDSTFPQFLDLLVDANQSWAKDTSVIGFVVAEKHFEHNGELNNYAWFDSGSAWMSMTLQARMEGFYTHGMGGFKAIEAAEYLRLDEEKSEVVMAFTIGKLADLNKLSEKQQEAETPNERKPLAEIWQQI